MSQDVQKSSGPKKPLIFADERSDVEKFDPRKHRGALDASRIPGYSEIVMANDIEAADDLAFRNAHRDNPHVKTKEDVYRMIGATPRALDVEFAWLPVSGAAGARSSNVDRVLDRFRHQEGYRLASKDDLESRGFGFPPAAREAEDGTIRRGSDVALFVRSSEVARMWHDFKFREQKEREGVPLTSISASGDELEAWARHEDSEVAYVKH